MGITLGCMGIIAAEGCMGIIAAEGCIGISATLGCGCIMVMAPQFAPPIGDMGGAMTTIVVGFAGAF